MRKFSVRPTLTIRGRKFKGLRGWSGKPTHPPSTDFPIAAYVLAAVFDVIAVFGRDESWARDFFRAGTYVFIGGAAVSVLAALNVETASDNPVWHESETDILPGDHTE